MINFISQTYPWQGWVLGLGLVAGLLLNHFVAAAKYFVTMIHEFGHALLARLTLGKVYQIRINYDTSGSTNVKSGLSGFVATLAGYPMPFLLALLLSAFVRLQRPQLTLLVLALISVFVLVKLRNAWGFLSVFVMLVLIVLAYFYATPDLNYGISMAVITELVVGGARDILVLFRNYQGTSDADLLEQQFATLPALFWKLVFCGLALFLTAIILHLFWFMLF